MRRQRRAEEGFEFQTVQLRMTDSLMLNEHLKRAAHTIRLQEMNCGPKLLALRLQFPDHLFNSEPHKKTHLVREPCHAESLLFTDGSQARKIHMGRHILFTDPHERIVVGQLLKIAEERAVLPLDPIEVLCRMAINDGHDKSTIDPLRDLFHPIHSL